MRLKDYKTLWGTSIVHLKAHSSKYRLNSIILYLVDIALVVILTAFMYYNHVNYRTYGFIIVALCLLFHFIIYDKLNPEKWEAFKFYKKHQSYQIKEKTYSVNDTNLYSILYCTGYKRLRQGRTFEEYKELMLSACCENIKYAHSIMKYINKYESCDGNLTCIIIEKGKKQYFIDFKEEEEVSDGDVNKGEITESESE